MFISVGIEVIWKDELIFFLCEEDNGKMEEVKVEEDNENGEETVDEKLVLYKRAFDIYDRKSEKLISDKDLITALRAVGNNPSEKEIVLILEELPPSKDGERKINFESFVKLADKYSEDITVTIDEFKSLFILFDKENSGKIHITLLGQILMNLGDKMTEQDFENMVKEIIEVDEQGNVYYVEFMEKVLNIKSS